MSSIGYARIHRLDLGCQLLHLHALNFPDSVARLRDGLLTFDYVAQPTPLSRTYNLRLSYNRGESPQVYVLSPNIAEIAAGRELVPHLYGHKHPVKLCLYLPRAREWGPEMSLARTVVPWSVDWLFHFEAWLATDEWSGGGEHPREKKQSRKQQNPKKKKL